MSTVRVKEGELRRETNEERDQEAREEVDEDDGEIEPSVTVLSDSFFSSTSVSFSSVSFCSSVVAFVFFQSFLLTGIGSSTPSIFIQTMASLDGGNVDKVDGFDDGLTTLAVEKSDDNCFDTSSVPGVTFDDNEEEG